MTDGFAGTWQLRGGVRVPIPAPERPNRGRPRKAPEDAIGRMVDLITWTPEALLAAHAAYERGNRDVYTVAGQRVYARDRKREQRKAVLSATDRRWCERNAVSWSWRHAEQHARLTSTTN